MHRKTRPRDTSTPLALLLDIMRDPTMPDELRVEAASRAAPYIHAPRQIIECRGTSTDTLPGAVEVYVPPVKH